METNQQQSRRSRIAVLIALIALLAPLTWYAVHQHGRSRAHAGAYGRMARSNYPTPEVTTPMAPSAAPQPIASPPPEVRETVVPPPPPIMIPPRRVAVTKHHHRITPQVAQTVEVAPKPEVALIPEVEKMPEMEEPKPPEKVSNMPPAVVRSTPSPRTGIPFSRPPEAPSLTINQTNLLGRTFDLIGTRYWLNGKPIQFSNDTRPSAVETRTVTAIEGLNVVHIQAVALGLDVGPRLYPNGIEWVPHGFDFVVDRQKTFVAHAGDRILVDSIVFEDEDLSKVMNGRMHLDANVSVAEPENTPLAER